VVEGGHQRTLPHIHAHTHTRTHTRTRRCVHVFASPLTAAQFCAAPCGLVCVPALHPCKRTRLGSDGSAPAAHSDGRCACVCLRMRVCLCVCVGLQHRVRFTLHFEQTCVRVPASPPPRRGCAQHLRLRRGTGTGPHRRAPRCCGAAWAIGSGAVDPHGPPFGSTSIPCRAGYRAAADTVPCGIPRRSRYRAVRDTAPWGVRWPCTGALAPSRSLAVVRWQLRGVGLRIQRVPRRKVPPAGRAECPGQYAHVHSCTAPRARTHARARMRRRRLHTSRAAPRTAAAAACVCACGSVAMVCDGAVVAFVELSSVFGVRGMSSNIGGPADVIVMLKQVRAYTALIGIPSTGVPEWLPLPDAPLRVITTLRPNGYR
jgi:hypothetical protein